MPNPRKQRRILQNPAFQGVLFAVAWLLVTNVTIYFIYLRSVEAVKGEIRDGLLRNVSMAATPQSFWSAWTVDTASRGSFGLPYQCQA